MHNGFQFLTTLSHGVIYQFVDTLDTTAVPQIGGCSETREAMRRTTYLEAMNRNILEVLGVTSKPNKQSDSTYQKLGFEHWMGPAKKGSVAGC